MGRVTNPPGKSLAPALAPCRAVGATVRPFLKGLGIRLRTIEDKFGKVSERYGVAGKPGGTLPRTFVLDGKGTVVAIFGREGADFTEVLLGVIPSAGP